MLQVQSGPRGRQHGTGRRPSPKAVAAASVRANHRAPVVRRQCDAPRRTRCRGKHSSPPQCFGVSTTVRSSISLVIFVPNVNLVDQTVDAYARIGVHLDRRPRDGVLEHPDTVGLVVCYQSLSDAAAEAHAARMAMNSTLVIFDEVHHLAERDHSAWGRFVEAMVGDVANQPPLNATAVFNMTGTLFRSAKSQRISTVRYKRVGENKFEAIPDWSVPTAQLVGIELRAPDLYVYGGKARLVDLENEKIIESEIVDLSQLQRSAVSREMFRSKSWLKGICTDGLRLLKNQLLTLNGEVPLKLLHVADDQRTAKLAADIYNEIGVMTLPHL